MPHPPERTDSVLEQITASILSRVEPSRIILFGSRARGDARPNSDYDVAVELETELPAEECKELLYGAMPRNQRRRIDIHLVKPGALDAYGDDPGLVYHDIAREGTVIYPVGGGRLSPPPLRVREAPHAPPESVRVWVGFAEEDMRAIEILLAAEHTPWSAVCFHAQQAAEKYLKALLVQRWLKPKRTHDLSELLETVFEANYSLPDLFDECALLAGYAIGARYPSEEPAAAAPCEREGRLAVAALRTIVDAAKKDLPSA